MTSVLGNERSKGVTQPGRTCRVLLEREEIRALLGDVGIGLAFESDACDSGKTASGCASFSSWEVISREVFGGGGKAGGTVVETSVMHVNSMGSLVRCITYPDGEPSRVADVVMEFVPGFRQTSRVGRTHQLD